MRPELQGLSGGKKQVWLQNHLSEVQEYFYSHGGDACMIEFNLKPRTMRDCLLRNPERFKDSSKLSQADAWVYRQLMSYTRTITRRVAGCERRLEEHERYIAVVKSIVEAAGFKVRELVKADPLEITDFRGKLEE